MHTMTITFQASVIQGTSVDNVMVYDKQQRRKVKRS